MAQPAAELSAPIACDLSAIPLDQRASHVALARSLFRSEYPVTRLSDGLEASLPADRLGDVVSFIENERRCCRHLAFSLEVPASQGALLLRVVGPGAIDELEALMR